MSIASFPPGTRVACYPGSFDPVTNGHLDIINRASGLFDYLVVCVLHNPGKEPLFTTPERVQMLEQSCRGIPNVVVDSYDGLLVDYLQKKGIRIVIKGLRPISDFDFEFEQALMNKRLNNAVETLFMVTSTTYSYLRSSLVKELARFGSFPPGLVPVHVETKLRERFRAPERQTPIETGGSGLA